MSGLLLGAAIAVGFILGMMITVIALWCLAALVEGQHLRRLSREEFAAQVRADEIRHLKLVTRRS